MSAIHDDEGQRHAVAALAISSLARAQSEQVQYPSIVAVTASPSAAASPSTGMLLQPVEQRGELSGHRHVGLG
jgi:hypothetical protein